MPLIGAGTVTLAALVLFARSDDTLTRAATAVGWIAYVLLQIVAVPIL